jgi:hypothetical protein
MIVRDSALIGVLLQVKSVAQRFGEARIAAI